MDQEAVNYDKHTKVWSGNHEEPLHNLEHQSLGAILYEQMRNHSNKILQIDDVEGKSITNHEALTWAICIAKHLKKVNLGQDGIVGIAARNSTFVMPVAMGCLLNSIPLHAVSPTLDESILAYCFGSTKPKVLFCDGSDYDKIVAATKSHELLIYTIYDHIEGVSSVLDLLHSPEMELFYQPEKPILGANQTVAILCSSGTTGLPKAVTMSASIMLIKYNDLYNGNAIFSFSGLNWVSGFRIMVCSCYNSCTRIITNKNFTPEYFVELAKKYKLTNVNLLPRNMVALAECPQFTKDNVESIKVLLCGGSGVTVKTLEKVENVLIHSTICIIYGLTELGPVSNSFDLEHGNSVGKLLPNMKLRIVDENGKNLGPNETGEILVKSTYPWAGYYGNPTETQRMRDSLGWFHTGDLGFMDEDGFLFVIDRLREICQYLGKFYWPGEIENVIRELPDVIDCCVVGIYDEHFGDVAGALVMKHLGSPLKEQEIVDHVKLHLKTPMKQLHNGVVFVHQLPHNCNGKTVTREAKELFKKLKNFN